MANKIKLENSKRTFLYLGDMGETVKLNAMRDERFQSVSAYARHIMELGIKADEKLKNRKV